MRWLGIIAAALTICAAGWPGVEAATIQAGRTRIAFSTRDGLRLTAIRDVSTGQNALGRAGQCPLLVISAAGKQFRAADARVVEAEPWQSGLRLRLRWPDCPLEATVGVRPGRGDETIWTLALSNRGPKTVFAKAAEVGARLAPLGKFETQPARQQDDA